MKCCKVVLIVLMLSGLYACAAGMHEEQSAPADRGSHPAHEGGIVGTGNTYECDPDTSKRDCEEQIR